MRYHAPFSTIPTTWNAWMPHAGQIVLEESGLRLGLLGATAAAYSDAQLDDYAADGRLRWRPPLRFELRARFGSSAGPLQGTAGFGFWNDPLGTRRRRPALPRAVWFFYAAPPANIALDSLVPGWGWKAMTMDASRPAALLLAPLIPLGLPLMWQPWLRRALWPIGQWALGVREARVQAPMREWHSYSIEWHAERVRFAVDQQVILESRLVPRGPLGLVLWVDNQFAIVTPGGRLGGGLLAGPAQQSLELAALTITQEELDADRHP